MCPLLAEFPLATRAVLSTKPPNRTHQAQKSPTHTHCPQDEAKFHGHKYLKGMPPESQCSN